MLLLLLPILDRPHPLESGLREALTGPGITWAQLDSLIGHFRTAKPDLSISALQAFLFVAKKLAEDGSQDVTVKDIADGLGVPYATVARNCDVFCEGPKGRGGLNWLVKLPGKQHKTNTFQLTARGHLYLKTVLLGSSEES